MHHHGDQFNFEDYSEQWTLPRNRHLVSPSTALKRRLWDMLIVANILLDADETAHAHLFAVSAPHSITAATGYTHCRSHLVAFD